ncbi:hypothetical protein AB0392_37845 [Nonomuraea angiospora]|uniref:hypothetical protein n=1 Tax=Nonomuraea angiospora TaxID=46172 RepID=UPI003450D93B
MPDTTATALLYAGPEGYFDVIGALPDAPPGSVIVNVSGILFGLHPHDIALLLNLLGPDAEHGQVMLLLKDPDGQLWLTATSGPDGLDLVVSFPACGANARVLVPHEQAAAVRAAIEEATRQ